MAEPAGSVAKAWLPLATLVSSYDRTPSAVRKIQVLQAQIPRASVAWLAPLMTRNYRRRQTLVKQDHNEKFWQVPVEKRAISGNRTGIHQGGYATLRS